MSTRHCRKSRTFKCAASSLWSRLQHYRHFAALHPAWRFMSCDRSLQENLSLYLELRMSLQVRPTPPWDPISCHPSWPGLVGYGREQPGNFSARKAGAFGICLVLYRNSRMEKVMESFSPRILEVELGKGPGCIGLGTATGSPQSGCPTGGLDGSSPKF